MTGIQFSLSGVSLALKELARVSGSFDSANPFWEGLDQEDKKAFKFLAEVYFQNQIDGS